MSDTPWKVARKRRFEARGQSDPEAQEGATEVVKKKKKKKKKAG